MSQPFVSAYDEVFNNAFDKGAKEMPKELPRLVKDMVDKFHEEVFSSLENYILDDMKANLDRGIKDYASQVASSMLANALAGDDKEIRNLFGFNEWYMKHPFISGDRFPTEWALIDAIAARRPDILVSERIAQRDCEIHKLNQTIVNLTRQLDYMKNNYVVPE